MTLSVCLKFINFDCYDVTPFQGYIRTCFIFRGLHPWLLKLNPFRVFEIE